MSNAGVLSMTGFIALLALSAPLLIILLRQARQRRRRPVASPAEIEASAAPPAGGNVAAAVVGTFIEASPDSICLCRDGVIIYVNAAGRRLLGDTATITGSPLARFVHPDYQILCEDNCALLLGETSATPMKFVLASGRPIDVLVSATPAEQIEDAVLVVVRNISDLMRANRDVAAQAKRLDSILDTTVDGIVISNEHGRIETFNRSAEVLFGYSAQEAVGQQIDMLVAGEDAAERLAAIRRHWLGPRDPKAGPTREIQGRRKNGTQFAAEMSVSVCDLNDRRLYTALIRDITERQAFEQQLAYSASHDELTGLPNRRLLQERLQQAMDEAEQRKGWVAVCFLDLDGLKTINDVMGYAAGDQLLVQAAHRMQATVGPGNTVARFGGDEFAIIFHSLADRQELIAAIKHFLAEVTRPYVLPEGEVGLSASLGVALFPEHGAVATDLVVHASAAMVLAKAQGWNEYRFYDPAMLDRAAERLTVENELRRGIERGELILQYQPQIELKTGLVVGLEALVRWNHPNMGLVQPARFISVAEQSGLIMPLGRWVLQQACLDLRKLEDAGIHGVSVAVNISPRQFNDSQLIAEIEQVIRTTGVQPAHLDLEITESTLMHDPEHVVVMLERIKALGVRLSIDDFGTGYSSLNYLKRFPVDTLKIDRSFVIGLGENPKDEAIAVTIITLAHSMGMTALAEGVEWPRQGEILHRHRCDVIQGYLYGRPMDLEAATDLIQQRQRVQQTA